VNETVNRRIVYGRRQGRPLRAGRRQALAETLPSCTLDLAGLDRPLTLMPGAARLALEVGFGSGEHTAAQARAQPQTLFLAAEPFINGVSALAKTIADDAIANIRIHHGDARAVLEHLPDACLDAAYVLFPDPWPKARHWKRRFVSQPNLEALARVLKPGGVLRVASDIPGYVAWTLEQIALFNRARPPSFLWTAEAPADWRVRAHDWPPTRYEGKALAAGRVPAYLALVRL
jgi:tRNA (guanine-N7-)-methyltransferase